MHNHSVLSDSANPLGSSVHWDFPGKNTGVGCHALLQGIFPIQESNGGLLLWRQILHHLNHQGSPRILAWVAYPFSRGSSWPSNQTGVSYIAGELDEGGQNVRIVIRQISTEDITYNMIKIINTVVLFMLYMKVMIANPESSPHKEKSLFSFSFLSIWDDRYSLSLLWYSFHDVCKSNHYAIHLKLIKCYMSVISQ